MLNSWSVEGTGYVTSLAFNGKGDKLAAGSSNGCIRIWDMTTGECQNIVSERSRSTPRNTSSNMRCQRLITKLEVPHGAVTSLAWSCAGEGACLAAASNEAIYLWDINAEGVATASSLTVSSIPTKKIRCLAWSKDGHRLASASEDYSVRTFTVARQARPMQGSSGTSCHGGPEAYTAFPDATVLAGHTGHARSVTWNPAGDLLASGSSDRTVRLWRADSGQPVGAPLQGHKLHVTSVAFGHGGDWLASGSWDKTIRVWDTASASLAAHPHSPPHERSPQHHHADGGGNPHASASHAAESAGDGGGGGGGVRSGADCPPTAPLCTLRGHSSRVNAVAFSPEGSGGGGGGGGRLLASVAGDRFGEDNTVRLWDVGAGRAAAAAWGGHAGPVCAAAFDPRGNTLVTADTAGAVVVWDVIRSQARMALAMAGHPRLGRGAGLGRLQGELLAVVARELAFDQGV